MGSDRFWCFSAHVKMPLDCLHHIVFCLRTGAFVAGAFPGATNELLRFCRVDQVLVQLSALVTELQLLFYHTCVMYFSSDSNYCHNGCRACCGDGFSVFSSDNGIVLTCGDGSVGCLGHGDWLSISRPRLIEALLRFDHVVLSTNATRSLTHSAQRNHCLLSLFAFQANEERKRKKERLGA